MIKLTSTNAKFKTDEVELKFETTIFPDKTSQVWRITPEPVHVWHQTKEIRHDLFKIYWNFENEAEVMHVLQLGELLRKYNGFKTELIIQNTPYARQDKDIANDTTFAFRVFMGIFEQSDYFNKIKTIDVHNPKLFYSASIWENILPNERIAEVLSLTDTDIVCYPDKGASLRGYKIDESKYGAPIVLDKNRNQETGEILGLKFSTKFKPDLTGFNVTLVDDIADGMRTFIEAAKILKLAGANRINLYTTQGIYSKGTKIAFDAGIDRIFNYNEEIVEKT